MRVINHTTVINQIKKVYPFIFKINKKIGFSYKNEKLGNGKFKISENENENEGCEFFDFIEYCDISLSENEFHKEIIDIHFENDYGLQVISSFSIRELSVVLEKEEIHSITTSEHLDYFLISFYYKGFSYSLTLKEDLEFILKFQEMNDSFRKNFIMINAIKWSEINEYSVISEKDFKKGNIKAYKKQSLSKQIFIHFGNEDSLQSYIIEIALNNGLLSKAINFKLSYDNSNYEHYECSYNEIAELLKCCVPSVSKEIALIINKQIVRDFLSSEI